MYISFGKDFYDTVPKERDVSFEQFVALCEGPRHHGKLLAAQYAKADRTERSRDKDGPWFIAGRFVPADRRTECLQALAGFVCDFDNGCVGRKFLESVFGRAGVLENTAFVAWTSYSHGIGRLERWRVFIPYTKAIEPSRHAALYAHFSTIFEGHLDPSCKKPAQLWYLPGCPADATPIAQVFKSDQTAACFNPDDVHAPMEPVVSALPGSVPQRVVGSAGRDANSDLTGRALPVLADIIAALNALPKQEYADHDRWVSIGMAVWAGTEGSDQGRRIWDRWSSTVPGYDPALIDSKWRSFGGRSNGITVATLFHLAGAASRNSAPSPVAGVPVTGNNAVPAVHAVQLALPLSTPIPPSWRNSARADGTMVIQQKVSADDGSGNMMWETMITGYHLIRVDSLDNQDDGRNTEECEFLKPGGPIYVQIPGDKLSSPADLASVLCDKGVNLVGAEAKSAQELIVDWLKKVQHERNERKTVSKWGWVTIDGAIEGFAAGTTVYRGDGTTIADGVVHANDELRDRYSPQGSLAAWKTVADFISRQGRMPLVTLLASAFAAPLVRLSGLDGVLLSVISTKSGVGKSTAMQAAQAVWGSNLAMHSTDDTVNAFGAKMGLLQNLPCYWDDIKGENAYERLPDLVYQITQGREKARMDQNRKTSLGRAWSTMAAFAANESIIERMRPHDNQSGTDASIARIFEIRIDGDPGTDRETPVFFEGIRTNYGLAGAVMAQALAKNHARYKDALGKLTQQLEKELAARPEERFWIMAVATLVLGATIARSLGLVDFNVPALKTYLCEQFDAMRNRKVKAVQATTPIEILRDMIGDLTPETVTVKLMPRQGGPKNNTEVTGHPLRKEIISAMRSEDQHYRVRKRTFTEWMAKARHNGAGILRELEKLEAVTEGIYEVAASTQYAKGDRQRCYQIDLSKLGF